MKARVSNIESFRQWREDEDQSVEDLVRWLTTDTPSEPMLAGSAFHKALELSDVGVFDTLQADGFTFLMPDAEIVLPEIRELRTYKVYGDLAVTGCVDCLEGKRIEDHKTTSRVDLERYLAGYQWRFYLDLFNANVFRWNVYEIKKDPKRPRTYEVKPPQTLDTFRYPGLHEDCARLAADYLDFAREHMTEAA